MDDIAKSLRNWAGWMISCACGNIPDEAVMMLKAADEIEKLRDALIDANVGADVTPLPALNKAKKGRPKTDFNKEEYNRLYMRDLRTIKRLGLSITVAQYRKSKEKTE